MLERMRSGDLRREIQPCPFCQGYHRLAECLNLDNYSSLSEKERLGMAGKIEELALRIGSLAEDDIQYLLSALDQKGRDLLTNKMIDFYNLRGEIGMKDKDGAEEKVIVDKKPIGWSQDFQSWVLRYRLSGDRERIRENPIRTFLWSLAEDKAEKQRRERV